MTAQEELDQSRLFCQELTRREAKNFYYGLRLLPPAKRAAMFALYAYMRQVDDIVDAEDGPAPQGREEQLESWRRQTHAVLAGDATPDGHAVWPAFADMVRHYSIPERVFEEFDHLYEYCYRVAGVVGLACIYIWGFEGGARTEQLAVDRGIAFQLTNILRDLREDAGRGRVYLPRSELTKLQLSDQDLLGDGDASGEPFLQMMRQQIERAELYYQKSAGLEERVSRDSRPTLVAMTAIYRGLLRKVSRRPERVLDGRVSLSVPSKLLIGWRALRAR
jgi:phytoene synthase